MTVVLAPVDGSTRALRAVPWAAKLAGPGGTVVLLRVVPPQPDYAETLFSLVGAEDTVEEIQDAWTQTAKADMDEAAALLSESGVTVERDGWRGRAGRRDRGRRRTTRGRDDRHGQSWPGRRWSCHLRQRCRPCRSHRTCARPDPAHARRGCGSQRRRLSHRRSARRLGNRGNGHSRSPARSPSSSRRLCTSCARSTRQRRSRWRQASSARRRRSTPEVADQIWQEAETEARSTVTTAVSRLQAEGVDASGAIVNGSPFFAISEATQPGDLLILTSHGRGGVRRWLLGSVAEKLVREANAPVMLVPAVERGEESRSREVEE